MLSNLVESKPQKSRRAAGTIASFTAHYGLILSAVLTSAQASTVRDGPREEKITFVDARKDEPLQRKEPPREEALAPRPVKQLQVLIAPVHIASELPDIDLSQGITDPDAFVRKGSPTVAPAAPTTAVKPASGEAYGEREVEKPVMQAPNSAAPVYPDILRQAGVEGEALVMFVVDTTGRVETGTFKVIRTTHELFAVAVKNALPRMRFFPAEVGSNKVRQLVQQPYTFAIVK